MLTGLQKMPQLPHTNEYGVEFTQVHVDQLYNYGCSLIKKFYRTDPAQYGLEIMYAILRTMERADSHPKAYFRQALLYRVLYEIKITAKNSHREVPVGDYFDSIASEEQEDLYSNSDVNKFTSQLEPRLSSLMKLLLSGHSYRDAASKLGVSKSQIGNDVQQVRKAWIEFNGGQV